MRIPSSDIPQADVLADVIATARAVNNGASTFQDIAQAIEKVERQGRYYRRAAEILGLIRNHRNHAELTSFGEQFFAADLQDQTELLKSAVLHASIFQRIIPFLENFPYGVTRDEITSFIENVTEPVGPSMIGRRVSSIIGWLQYLDIIYLGNGVYRLNLPAFSDLPPIEYSADEPLIPNVRQMRDYEIVRERTLDARSVVSYWRNAIAMERANQAHVGLVNLIASRIRASGVTPRYNQLIDLAARVNNVPYIFEMKSTTAENYRSQIRRGMS